MLANSTGGWFRRSDQFTGDSTFPAEDLLLEQYEDSNLLRGTLRAFLAQLPELENIIKVDFPRQFSIYNAFGVWLDTLGDYVGEYRNGLLDDEFRQNIIFRIFLNNGSGTGDDVIAFVLNYLPGSDCEYIEVPPARIHLTVIYNKILPSNFLERVDKVAAGGVSVTADIIDPGNYFGFDDDDTAFGFGEKGVGNENVGGNFVEKV